MVYPYIASFPLPSFEFVVPRNRGTSKRTRLSPMGEVRHQSVRDGNMIAARTLVLCYIAAALAAWWVLEQPTNSIMEELPCFKWFTRQVSTFRHSINMCDYGGPTKKPTWLYSGFLGVNLVLEDQHFCFISLNVFVPKFRVFGGTICYRFRIWSHATPNVTPI